MYVEGLLGLRINFYKYLFICMLLVLFYFFWSFFIFVVIWKNEVKLLSFVRMLVFKIVW